MQDQREPCHECKRVHRGRHCKPGEARSVKVNFTIPAHVARELDRQIPWGDRSKFAGYAIEAALEFMELQRQRGKSDE